MENIFELFGFLSMACISAAIIFIVMGKKDGLKAFGSDALTTEYNITADAPNAPKGITKGSRGDYSSDSGSARRAKGSQENTASNQSAEDRLKMLYNDSRFVAETSKKWQSTVEDIADEYNVKPQFLLANLLIQSYIGDYSKSQLVADATQHAGDRVMPGSAAAKRYEYGWSVQKISDQYRLAANFAQEIPTAAANAAPSAMASSSSSKGASNTRSSSKVVQTAQSSPMESGFQNMVAKEYGFSSWNGLQRLGDAGMKNDAKRRVKSLMMAARIK